MKYTCYLLFVVLPQFLMSISLRHSGFSLSDISGGEIVNIDKMVQDTLDRHPELYTPEKAINHIGKELGLVESFLSLETSDNFICLKTLAKIQQYYSTTLQELEDRLYNVCFKQLLNNYAKYKDTSKSETLKLNTTQTVENCNLDVNESMSKLCSAKALRNSLVKNCDDFKNKEIINCETGIFNVENCICPETESFKITRVIQENNNTLGFSFPQLSYNLKCTNGQNICEIQEYKNLLNYTNSLPYCPVIDTYKRIQKKVLFMTTIKPDTMDHYSTMPLNKDTISHSKSGRSIQYGTYFRTSANDDVVVWGTTYGKTFYIDNFAKMYIDWKDGNIVIMRDNEELTPNYAGKVQNQNTDDQLYKFAVIKIGAPNEDPDPIDPCGYWLKRLTVPLPPDNIKMLDYISQNEILRNAVIDMIYKMTGKSP